MKRFLITIDTESDNQWVEKSTLTAQNARFIPRFQDLCEKYGFLPVYLTDYTMANDDYYCGYMKEKLKDGLCEIGMHLHAWDTPPVHQLDGAIQKPYLIEYPLDVMSEKIKTITNKLEDVFQVKMKSHRAGRWAMNEEYAHFLIQNGYSVDCSVTPGISWKNQLGAVGGGSDYSCKPQQPYYLDEEQHLLEVPMTIRKLRIMEKWLDRGWRGFLRGAKNCLLGKSVWMRPSISNEVEMTALLDCIKAENSEYLEFMMHSSEFMPGGSPYYSTKGEIDSLFLQLDRLFGIIAETYYGCTLANFAEQYRCREEVL